MNQYDLRDQQEISARHHVRWAKAFYASLIIGAMFLMLPRAVPWFSSGVPEMAMGRVVGSISGSQLAPFAITAGLHIILAVGYGVLLAMIIFRFEIRLALLFGTLTGLALYGINFVLFRTLFGTPAVNEVPVVFTHLFFSLVFSAAYKGISVPDAAKVADRNQSA